MPYLDHAGQRAIKNIRISPLFECFALWWRCRKGGDVKIDEGIMPLWLFKGSLQLKYVCLFDIMSLSWPYFLYSHHNYAVDGASLFFSLMCPAKVTVES